MAATQHPARTRVALRLCDATPGTTTVRLERQDDRMPGAHSSRITRQPCRTSPAGAATASNAASNRVTSCCHDSPVWHRGIAGRVPEQAHPKRPRLHRATQANAVAGHGTGILADEATSHGKRTCGANDTSGEGLTGTLCHTVMCRSPRRRWCWRWRWIQRQRVRLQPISTVS